MADDVLSGEDWGNIHAKAWREAGFKSKLETDPTAAVREWAGQQNPPRTITKIVIVRERPTHIKEEFWPDVNPFPPSCC